MNRHMSDLYSAVTAGGELPYRYMLGLYEVLERIFTPRPHILLETCSSGGNRFDLGMLCYSPQIWSSDDTDPIERLSIQKGLSYFYPPCTMALMFHSRPTNRLYGRHRSPPVSMSLPSVFWDMNWIWASFPRRRKSRSPRR